MTSVITGRRSSGKTWSSHGKCQAGCPVATDAGRYVQLIAEGRDEEAFLVARAPNPFASVWPLSEYNRPEAGRAFARGGPVIYEGTFRAVRK